MQRITNTTAGKRPFHASLLVVVALVLLAIAVSRPSTGGDVPSVGTLGAGAAPTGTPPPESSVEPAPSQGAEDLDALLPPCDPIPEDDGKGDHSAPAPDAPVDDCDHRGRVVEGPPKQAYPIEAWGASQAP